MEIEWAIALVDWLCPLPWLSYYAAWVWWRFVEWPWWWVRGWWRLWSVPVVAISAPAIWAILAMIAMDDDEGWIVGLGITVFGGLALLGLWIWVSPATFARILQTHGVLLGLLFTSIWYYKRRQITHEQLRQELADFRNWEQKHLLKYSPHNMRYRNEQDYFTFHRITWWRMPPLIESRPR